LVIPKNRKFDFISIDVQGAEYDVIKGGERIFKNLIGIALESHFFEYYKGEKLFPEIHNLLKKNFRLLKMNPRLMGGEIAEIGDTFYIKKHNLIKKKEDLIKRILFSSLFNRKEHIIFLLKNYSHFISSKDGKDIRKIFNIHINEYEKIRKISLNEWCGYSATKEFFDGTGY
jgi:hypothetical protein